MSGSETMTDLSEAALTAVDFKNAGNKLCSLLRYEEAIDCYNKAINKNPEVAIFYSNRALCYLKLTQWPQAMQDCRRALEIEPNLVKAHFFLGQALAETGNFNDAIKHLQRAHELSKEQKLNFGDDITYQIRLTKRRRWSNIEEDTTQMEDKMLIYLRDLINKDKQTRLKDLITREESAKTRNKISESENLSCNVGDTKPSPPEPEATTSTSTPTSTIQFSDRLKIVDGHDIKSKEQHIIDECDNYVEALEKMFSELRSQRRMRDVPDYLCGKISFEIMQDPVLTPSGITYDRKDIEEHLRRVGHFDPITRQPLQLSQLISNLAMKEVVDAYLKDNEWALYY